MDPTLLSNISVLYHSLGHVREAGDFCKQALREWESRIAASSEHATLNPAFKSPGECVRLCVCFDGWMGEGVSCANMKKLVSK